MKTGRNQLLYIVFYLLFSPETWRVLIGLVAAVLIGPRATAGGGYGPAGQSVIWLMILVIFYVLSAPVGKFISRRLTTVFKKGPGVKFTARPKKNRKS